MCILQWHKKTHPNSFRSNTTKFWKTFTFPLTKRLISSNTIWRQQEQLTTKTAKTADIMDSVTKGSQALKNKLNLFFFKKGIDIERCKEDNFFAKDIIFFNKMSPIARYKSYKYRTTKKTITFRCGKGWVLFSMTIHIATHQCYTY